MPGMTLRPTVPAPWQRRRRPRCMPAAAPARLCLPRRRRAAGRARAFFCRSWGPRTASGRYRSARAGGGNGQRRQHGRAAGCRAARGQQRWRDAGRRRAVLRAPGRERAGRGCQRSRRRGGPGGGRAVAAAAVAGPDDAGAAGRPHVQARACRRGGAGEDAWDPALLPLPWRCLAGHGRSGRTRPCRRRHSGHTRCGAAAAGAVSCLSRGREAKRESPCMRICNACQMRM